jgi:hypothetical protein
MVVCGIIADDDYLGTQLNCPAEQGNAPLSALLQEPVGKSWIVDQAHEETVKAHRHVRRCKRAGVRPVEQAVVGVSISDPAHGIWLEHSDCVAWRRAKA